MALASAAPAQEKKDDGPKTLPDEIAGFGCVENSVVFGWP